MPKPCFNLGRYSRPISTVSKQAQSNFDLGLNWCYGFNHEEALNCFQRVIEYDSQCVMGYWGIAYASGPFYNRPWQWFSDSGRSKALQDSFHALQHAMRLKDQGTEIENQLVAALAEQYPRSQGDLKTELPLWSERYINALRALLQGYPEDIDVIFLTAEALMNATPWKLWDIHTGVAASTAHTAEAMQVLQQGLDLIARQNLIPHPGILHFHIHLLEMSPTPEKALESAECLRQLCPDSGHLVHMASHIDVLFGRWQQAVSTNSKAIQIDRDYLKHNKSGPFYIISILHNYHFKIYAAMFIGQFNSALSATKQLRALITDSMLESSSQYLKSTIEAYYASTIHLQVRFGHWQKITEEAFPSNQALYPITTIMLHYAKTIAFATLGDIDSAQVHKNQFHNLAMAVPDWHTIANNPTVNILAVAEAVMHGEFEYHVGHHHVGYAFLRDAVRLYDHLAYSEPWPWMHPPRHALGALLLEQGHVKEALQHYQDDLGISQRLPHCLQHRNNIWSLHGYSECLKRLGRLQELDALQPQLTAAMAQSEVPITSSCCCRKQPFAV